MGAPGSVLGCPRGCGFGGHLEAYERLLQGEILPNGQLSERLSDPHRRREINYHGVPSHLASPAAPTPQR